MVWQNLIEHRSYLIKEIRSNPDFFLRGFLEYYGFKIFIEPNSIIGEKVSDDDEVEVIAFHLDESDIRVEYWFYNRRLGAIKNTQYPYLLPSQGTFSPFTSSTLVQESDESPYYISLYISALLSNLPFLDLYGSGEFQKRIRELYYSILEVDAVSTSSSIGEECKR